MADNTTWVEIFLDHKKAQKALYPDIQFDVLDNEALDAILNHATSGSRGVKKTLSVRKKKKSSTGVSKESIDLQRRELLASQLEKFFRGVTEVRNRYKAELQCSDGVIRLIGRYDTAVMAAMAHDAAARSHFRIKEAEKITNFPFGVILDILPGFHLDISQFQRSLETPDVVRKPRAHKNKSKVKEAKEVITTVSRAAREAKSNSKSESHTMLDEMIAKENAEVPQ